MDVCPKCDGKNIEKGIIRGSKNVKFAGEHKKALAGDSKIEAFVCLDCGYLELSVDKEDVKKKMKPGFNTTES